MLARKIVVDPFAHKLFADHSAEPLVPLAVAAFQNKLNQLYSPAALLPGYAPFCKHLILPNFTEALPATAPITGDNQHLLRTRYEARTEKELPVLARYFLAKDLVRQKAKFLDVILYSKEQVQSENAAMGSKDPHSEQDYDFGVVSVKPQDIDCEQPMEPITMMRNALGKAEGGSGVALSREKYLESVRFYEANARVVFK